ncbi:hypothetical protein [Cellulomonas sp.]|uniref:hypothetical protein n=1 Tax=Cellulomonas sp. TaxID=40001 RepID=UPI003BA8FC4E
MLAAWPVALTLALHALGPTPAEGLAPLATAGGDYVISGGAHEGTRTADGTSTVTLSATNLSAEEIALVLTLDDGSCSTATGEPSVPGHTSGDVTFEMNCAAGGAPREGSVAAHAVGNVEQTLTPAAIPVAVTFAPGSPSDWSPLRWYLWLAAPLAVVGVVPPYLFWLNRPRGNPHPSPAHPAKDASKIEPWWSPKHLSLSLPGITADWDFKENWASSVSLAAALFTTVFAGGDALESIVGKEATSTVGVVAVAAALTAGIVGSGPLWLTICKRRFDDQGGIARHNTIGGVLVASLVVLVGTFGLLFSAAAAIDLAPAWLAAWAAALVLLVYTWKSVPQTLALGRFGSPPDGHGQAVSASL